VPFPAPSPSRVPIGPSSTGSNECASNGGWSGIDCLGECSDGSSFGVHAIVGENGMLVRRSCAGSWTAEGFRIICVYASVVRC
jgi:hypothetical protein